jgi:hypothetical protein
MSASCVADGASPFQRLSAQHADRSQGADNTTALLCCVSVRRFLMTDCSTNVTDVQKSKLAGRDTVKRRNGDHRL